MLNEYGFFHGLVFIEIINAVKNPIKIQTYPSESNSSYAINDDVGIYIKYSTKRMSPWRFSFLAEHKNEIEEMHSIVDNVFIVLVCNTDGIVCLNYNELKNLLSDDNENIEWISATRSKREKYSIAGSAGSLHIKIGNSDFPRKITSVIKINS